MTDADRSKAAKKAAATRKANADAADRPAAKSQGALEREQQAAKEPKAREQRDIDAARKSESDYGRSLPTDQAAGSQGLKPQPNDPTDAPASDSVRKEAKAVNDPPKRKQETVKVHLRDANPQTVHDVKRLVVLLDGETTGSSETKGKVVLTVKVPLGSDRDPEAARDKLIGNLDADPLVEKVTT